MLFMVPKSLSSGGYNSYVYQQFKKIYYNGVMLTSDPCLQMQYEYQTGYYLEQIRVHASYFDESWSNKRPLDVLIVDRPHECVLMGVLQHFIDKFDYDDWLRLYGPE